ncbi:hypothetical protein PRJH_0174 [Providencia rustigianii]
MPSALPPDSSAAPCQRLTCVAFMPRFLLRKLSWSFDRAVSSISLVNPVDMNIVVKSPASALVALLIDFVKLSLCSLAFFCCSLVPFRVSFTPPSVSFRESIESANLSFSVVAFFASLAKPPLSSFSETRSVSISVAIVYLTH